MLVSGEWFEKGQEKYRNLKEWAVVIIPLRSGKICIWQIQWSKDQDLQEGLVE